MNILIFGKGSYIGENYYAALINKGHSVTMIDAIQTKVEDIRFQNIDVVINVAGIAHIKITPEMEDLFYKVNTTLAVDLCKAAKENGVKQYIYMSSMNVFGDTTDKIFSREQENPINFYGKSKWLADQQIHELEDDFFKVVSIRPPVVYGKGCKGNFPVLVKLSKFCLFFPKYTNTKSMIFIDNLCNIVCQIIDDGCGGFFHPQNQETTTISKIVLEIRKSMGKRTILIPGFEWAIKLLMKFSHRIGRAFANDYYDIKFSQYNGNNLYASTPFDESIRKSVK